MGERVEGVESSLQDQETELREEFVSFFILL